MPLDSGARLGHYEILAPIGAGGMGEVYRARDTRLGRDVAIKVLSSEFAKDSARVERFLLEARAASALNHPNIVHIYDVGEHEGLRFIAMELVEGRTLRQMLAEGPIPADDIVRYARQIVEGLVKAHEAGIVHRDLKPENIIIDKDGRVKILDFGLAKFKAPEDAGSEAATLDKNNRGVTTPGAVLGTVGYLSPEQAKGEDADFRSDLFSFGALLYEMLTGKKAFGRETAAESLAAVLKEEPDAHTATGSLAPVLAECLKKSPSERWESTDALLEALNVADVSPVPESPEPSIAVLPFANMSGDTEQEYFCDGVADEVINALSRVRNLRVVARTSAFAFKEQNVDIREIGEKLNVNHMLEGSVRKAGNRIRVTAQLIKVDDGYHLWSERFDRELDDIFAVQDEISLAIVEKLEVNLGGGERAALVKRPTENLELHNLYLLGRYHWRRLTEEHARKSQQYFEKAIELDPSFAPAHAGLAAIHQGGLALLPPRVAIPRARRAAERALELDPSSGDAHGALALVTIFHERNWPDALFHCKKALESDPNGWWAHNCYALYLSAAGRHDEAIVEIERAIALDPVSPLKLENAAAHYYWAGRYGQALEHCERCFSIDPDFSWAHLFVGLVEIQNGRLDNAIASFEKGRFPAKGFLGYALGASGETDRAREILESIEPGIESQTDSQYTAALVHFGLGDVERCFDSLEESTKENPVITLMSAWMNVDPFWDPLRDHARFQTVLSRMSFPN